jgi:hypothetical protein
LKELIGVGDVIRDLGAVGPWTAEQAALSPEKYRLKAVAGVWLNSKAEAGAKNNQSPAPPLGFFSAIAAAHQSFM